jgi:hypothetical protein
MKTFVLEILINTILNSKSLSKEIYNKLSTLENLEVDSIKGISKWKSDMETDINFSDVFCNLYLVTNDSKLKNFQYKRLHWTLPTNTLLVKIGIKNSDLSDFHLELLYIESTSKFSSVLSLLYISFDKLLEFRIVLIKWLLYSVFAMLFTFLLLMG